MESCGDTPQSHRVIIAGKRGLPWLAAGRACIPGRRIQCLYRRAKLAASSRHNPPHSVPSTSPQLSLPRTPAVVTMADPMSSGVKKVGCKDCQKTFSKAEHLRVSTPRFASFFRGRPRVGKWSLTGMQRHERCRKTIPIQRVAVKANRVLTRHGIQAVCLQGMWPTVCTSRCSHAPRKIACSRIYR